MINKFIIGGTLIREPELTDGGTIFYLSVLQICSKDYKNYFTIFCKENKLSNILQYLKKGQKILIEGYVNQPTQRNKVNLYAEKLTLI